MQEHDVISLVWSIGFAALVFVCACHFAVVGPFLRKRRRLPVHELFLNWRIIPLFLEYQRVARSEGRHSLVVALIWIALAISVACFLTMAIMFMALPS